MKETRHKSDIVTRLITSIWRLVISGTVVVIDILVAFATLVRGSKRPLPDRPLRILLTGTFYTDNWITTHLVPLARAESVGVVYMVSLTPVPPMDGVVAIYPAAWQIRLFGGTSARFITFARAAFRLKPDIVGGFHLLLNGLIGRLVAAIVKSRSIYFCGGGIREVEGGGYLTQNRLFNKLGYASPFVERLLIKAVSDSDYVITMGSSVRQYFSEQGAKGAVEVVPGGFDPMCFAANCKSQDRKYDLVVVGRLSPVKRLDLLLQSVAIVLEQGVQVSLVLVGDGPSMQELKAQADELGIAEHVNFAGWQDDVAAWLQQSRIFVLTSESEGLSQAMIQGMLCGLPAVVSDVGDLSDVVEDGKNGYLINELTASKFADAIGDLLTNEDRRELFASHARESAKRLSIESTAATWDRIFQSEPGRNR